MEVETPKEIKSKNVTPMLQRNEDVGGAEKCMTVLITIFSWLLIALMFPLALPMCIRMVQVQYLRDFVFYPESNIIITCNHL